MKKIISFLLAMIFLFGCVACTETKNPPANNSGGSPSTPSDTPAEDPDKDINLYINSPGGSVTAGMAIYDTMQYIKPDVSTICIGMAASMGAFLLAGGAKGKRYALPNAEVMIHQPSGGARGQATDICIHAENILRTKQKLNKILAENTGKPVEEVERDTERDNFMTAEEAKAYGLIDDVITRPQTKEK